VNYRRIQSTWVSAVLGDTVTFLGDEMLHRQEVDTVYSAVHQLMAGSTPIPLFILSHDTFTRALKKVAYIQNHLDESQPYDLEQTYYALNFLTLFDDELA